MRRGSGNRGLAYPLAPASRGSRPSEFELRRAVERLRDGLFDPLAVLRLTARAARIRKVADIGLSRAAGKGANLCIVGAYGRGKSHTLSYIRARAHQAGFVTSMVDLDPRERPFHNFRGIYRGLMENLRFPDSSASLAARWEEWVKKKLKNPLPGRVMAHLPREMPPLFRTTMAAMASRALSESRRRMHGLRHGASQLLLRRALLGEAVPVTTLRRVIRERGVDLSGIRSLRLLGNEPYVRMLAALGKLFQRMAYGGLALLFDEGESILQARIVQRNKSYETLDLFFRPPDVSPGLFSVFAFTGEFFRRLEAEDYQRIRVRRGEESPYFSADWSQCWRGLERHAPEELSRRHWKELSDKLTDLHGRAYGWTPPSGTGKDLAARAYELFGQETRSVFKALVEHLDLLHQERVFRSRPL